MRANQIVIDTVLVGETVLGSERQDEGVGESRYTRVHLGVIVNGAFSI